MALWARVQKLPDEALQEIHLAYGEHFPIEVRSVLADWIEDKPWAALDSDNPQHETDVDYLMVKELIKELESKASECDNRARRFKLCDAAIYFKHKYYNNPQQLVRIIKDCLHTERRIVQRAENFPRGLTSQMLRTLDSAQEINLSLEKLRNKTQRTAEDVRQMQQNQEVFVIQLQGSLKEGAQLLQSSNPEGKNQREQFIQALGQKSSDLFNLRIKIVESIERTYLELNELQKRILDTELMSWKRRQQLSGNGVPFENNLDQIQEWCEGLADIIWQNHQQIIEFECLCSLYQQFIPNEPADTMAQISKLRSQITNLISFLVTSTFIIEKHPPQVLKTLTKFAATVRLLVGSKLGIPLTPPQVTATIINEAQAIDIFRNGNTESNDSSGEILNNKGRMEYLQAKRQLSVSFKNMLLQKIKRAGEKGNEFVTDEKFYLSFQSKFKIGDEEQELEFQIWTLSLPIVVIVHGNQEAHAWATITWDNAFAEPCRAPFQVPDRVLWSEMSNVLSTKFKAATGRELTYENLQFLAWKALRSAQIHDISLYITWSQFRKECLPDRNFTFWEWFYAIMKISHEPLRELWNDDLILGFVSRHQAKEMLLKRTSGTFLLRFSDSELGGVTIAWVDSQQMEEPEVFMIQPYTRRDFSVRSLADRIGDFSNLLYLYPDIPKSQAFGKYYTPHKVINCSGYVKSGLVTHLPSLNGNGSDNFPNTPQSTMQSPDSSYYDTESSSDMQMGSQYAEMIESVIMPAEDPQDINNISMSELLPFSQCAAENNLMPDT